METPNDTQTLTGALRAMAAADSGLGASARVEDRLRIEVRGLARSRRRSRMTFTALAAGLTLALAVPLSLTLRHSVTEPAAPRTEQPFLATPYAGSFTGEGLIVRLEVPAATLRAYGVTTPVARNQRGDARVLADVIVGEDGVARAIRLVGPVPEVQR